MATGGGSSSANITPRMRVSDVEDRLVGTVLQTRPHAFCIEVQQASVWVSYDIVFRVEGNSVLLVCMREGIDKYRVGEDPD
jgi:hypothetical protein